MALLGFISFNLTMASMWGSFGVLITAIEAKMGVGREVSSLAAPVVMIAVALLAPLAGAVSGRVSLRLLMMIGSIMGAAGFALLAVASNIEVLLLGYGLLIGPAVCLCGAVLPPTLVTRWFISGRGRALGFVHLPVALVAAPLICAFVLRRYGLSAVYIMMSAVMVLNLVAQAFVQDYPPRTDGATLKGAKTEATNLGPATSEVLWQKRFWPMTIANASNIAGSVMLSAHLVPMAMGWGVEATKAASLLTLMSLAGLVGPVMFGWLADRYGGRVMQFIMCANSAVLWSILLTQPSFPILAAVIALFGLHSAGAVPTYGVALSEEFGQASFARAFGLGNMVSLPFTVLAVPLAASVYVRSGPYREALVIQSAFFLVAALLVLVVGARRVSIREG
jgi:MFS family permease